MCEEPLFTDPALTAALLLVLPSGPMRPDDVQAIARVLRVFKVPERR